MTGGITGLFHAEAQRRGDRRGENFLPRTTRISLDIIVFPMYAQFMNKLINIFSICGILFLFGCQSNSDRIIEFYEQERVKINFEVNEILKSLGFENFNVFVYNHVDMVGTILSQERIYTRYSGIGFNPEGPPGHEPSVMPAYSDIATMHGEVLQNIVRTNWDWDGKVENMHTHMAILIILGEITAEQRVELLKIFESYLVSHVQNTVIYIASRADF